MRTTRIAIMGIAILLLGGVIGLLLSKGSATPASSAASQASFEETTRAIEALPESRPFDPARLASIKPRPFTEPESETPRVAVRPGEIAVSGTVLDWSGGPAASAGVSLFRLDHGVPAGDAFAIGDTDDEGKFRLVLSAEPPPECVLAAYRPGRIPATLMLTFVGAESRNDVRLTLGIGAAIEGTVALDGRGVGGARVAATLEREGSGSLPMTWNGDGFDTTRATAYADEAGRFLLTGLAPGTYRLQTDQLAPDTSIGLWCQKTVLAPASGVRLGLDSGRFRIRVFSKGEPLAQAQVVAIDAHGTRLNVPESGELRVVAGVPFRVEAGKRGFVAKQLALAPLNPGEQRDVDVTLDPDQSPDLRLYLRGAPVANLSKIPVHLIPLQRAAHETICVEKDLRSDLQAVKVGDSLFVLEHVPHPAGDYVLVLLPQPPTSWFVPVETELTLPASGTVDIGLELAPAGRLQVWMRADDPSRDDSFRYRTGADFVLRDTRGVAVYSSLGDPTTPRSSAHAEAEALRRATKLVPPGTYQLECRREGFQERRQEITIVAGTENTTTIQLSREPR